MNKLNTSSALMLAGLLTATVGCSTEQNRTNSQATAQPQVQQNQAAQPAPAEPKMAEASCSATKAGQAVCGSAPKAGEATCGTAPQSKAPQGSCGAAK